MIYHVIGLKFRTGDHVRIVGHGLVTCDILWLPREGVICELPDDPLLDPEYGDLWEYWVQFDGIDTGPYGFDEEELELMT